MWANQVKAFNDMYGWTIVIILLFLIFIILLLIAIKMDK